MRLTLALALLLVPALSAADRLIRIPTGTKLIYRSLRFEQTFETGLSGRSEEYYGIGLGKSFDGALVVDRHGGAAAATFELAYSYLDPVVNFTPGITAGVVDALDRTEEGRRFFFAITYRSGLDGAFNDTTPAEATLGVFAGSSNSMFVGVSLPFSSSLRVLAEHDSFFLSAGVELRPLPDLAVRWLSGSRNGLSVSLRARF